MRHRNLTKLIIQKWTIYNLYSKREYDDSNFLVWLAVDLALDSFFQISAPLFSYHITIIFVVPAYMVFTPKMFRNKYMWYAFVALAWHPVHECLFASGGSDGAIMYWLAE